MAIAARFITGLLAQIEGFSEKMHIKHTVEVLLVMEEEVTR